MQWTFEESLSLFNNNNLGNYLLKGRWGLEKESLRINEDGTLALTPHPAELGSKSENPYITTDFSESQFELITPPMESIEESHNFLVSLEERVQNKLDGELIWPLSMPGSLPADDSIPVARFDNSRKGQEKEIYRTGLALRYGKKMQMISGIHYNFSFGEELLDLFIERFGTDSERRSFIDRLYCGLVRNFLRYRWLFIYLFGASPSLDEGYREEIERKIAGDSICCGGIDELFSSRQQSTSLRMSRFGYENQPASGQNVSYNSLEEHTADITRLLSTKSSDFAGLGIYKEGKQQQLNDRLLQLENEYYSPVRFKQLLRDGETQVKALSERGIEYLEIRTFDLDPFEKGGVGLNQLHFTQLFMLYCLFEGSPQIDDEEKKRIDRNAQRTALCGRNPSLTLQNNLNQQVILHDWGQELFNKMESIAAIVDKSSGSSTYTEALKREEQKLCNTALLPSAKIINEMADQDEKHSAFGLRRAKKSPYPNKENLQESCCI